MQQRERPTIDHNQGEQKLAQDVPSLDGHSMGGESWVHRARHAIGHMVNEGLHRANIALERAGIERVSLDDVTKKQTILCEEELARLLPNQRQIMDALISSNYGAASDKYERLDDGRIQFRFMKDGKHYTCMAEPGDDLQMPRSHIERMTMGDWTRGSLTITSNGKSVVTLDNSVLANRVYEHLLSNLAGVY
jgi:hypothetical protein